MTDETLEKVKHAPGKMDELTNSLSKIKKERDKALKARNLIDSKRSASAMCKLGAATKKIKKLEYRVDFLEEDAPATTSMAVCETTNWNI